MQKMTNFTEKHFNIFIVYFYFICFKFVLVNIRKLKI